MLHDLADRAPGCDRAACYNAPMDFRWQDVDPDLRLFIIFGVPMIAIGLYLKSVGFFGSEPVPDWSMPEQLQPVEEGRVE